MIRDLGSTNGTRLSGELLDPTTARAVARGARLSFGDEAEAWVLEDAGPPVPSATNVETGEHLVSDQGLLVLPNDDRPTATVFRDPAGMWQVELTGESVRDAVDQEILQAEGTFRLSIPPRIERMITTKPVERTAMSMSSLTLRFSVSHDHAFINLSLVVGARVVSLPPRAHHEMLLALAKERISDIAAGLPSAEQGWMHMSDLLPLTGQSAEHLNVSIQRARKQLAQAGVVDAGAIVERRPTTRQLRIGTAAIAIGD
jgi:hypothetical protein